MTLVRRQTISLLVERLNALPRLRSPASLAKRLLGFIHSGEAHRKGLSRLLRVGALLWLTAGAIVWLLVWPLVYEEFERWGLVRAFVAQMIWLATLLLTVKITLLRAEHVNALPPDDFVSLRAASVFCRWFAEVMLLQVVGAALAMLMQPINPLFVSILSSISPSASASGVGQALLGLISGAWLLLWLALAVPAFVLLYGVATAIDVYLAIEFNTRPERVGDPGA